MENRRTSGSRGISFAFITLNSLWITLTGILFLAFATQKGHGFAYIHFFTIIGTLLLSLPWLLQLLLSTTAILLHKTQCHDLMWIVQSSSASSSPSPSSSLQVLKQNDPEEEIAIKIVIEGRNKTKVLTNEST